MQDGDLGTWLTPRLVLVLEDCLARVTGAVKRHGIRKSWEPNDADEWEWGLTTVKTIQRYAWNSVPVDVITFISPEVRDLAAEWFSKYAIDVSTVQYYDLRSFQRSLTWRRNGIQRVIDTDPERLLHYGQLGYQTMFDREF
jgi:hypothetical protein